MADNEALAPPDPASTSTVMPKQDINIGSSVPGSSVVTNTLTSRTAPLASKSTLRITPKFSTITQTPMVSKPAVTNASLSPIQREVKEISDKPELVKPANTSTNQPMTPIINMAAIPKPITPSTPTVPPSGVDATLPLKSPINPDTKDPTIVANIDLSKPSASIISQSTPVSSGPVSLNMMKPTADLAINYQPGSALNIEPKLISAVKVLTEEEVVPPQSKDGKLASSAYFTSVPIEANKSEAIPNKNTGEGTVSMANEHMSPVPENESNQSTSSKQFNTFTIMKELPATTEPMPEAREKSSLITWPEVVPFSPELAKDNTGLSNAESAKIINQEPIDDVKIIKQEPIDDVKMLKAAHPRGEGKDEPVEHIPKKELYDENGYPEEVSKASIRKRIWDYLEANNLANFPRPVHNRIPNFKGAAAAGDKAATLDVFKKAQTVKINPDKPQEQCRFLTIESQKNLLVPTPRLRQGLFNRINVPENANKEMLKLCSTSQGIKEHSSPISLDSKVKIDLIIVGSVAVSRKGYRIGKGEGFADLEFGMMRAMEAVDENIIVVTTVHESQIEEIPDHLMQPHDLTVDFIVTPTNIYPCERHKKPTGIIWSMLTKEKLSRVPILKKLRERQREAGIDVTLKDGEEPEASESNPDDPDRPRQRDRRRRRRNTRRQENEKGDMEKVDGDVHEKGEHSGENGEDKEGRRREKRNTRRRRRRSTRKSEGEGGECSEGDNGPESGLDAEKDNNPDDRRRRPQRRRRRRSAKSHDGEGHSGEDDRKDRDGDNVKPHRDRPPKRRPSSGPLATVYVGALPRSLRVSEFKAQVREKGINPLRVIWHGASGHAFLQFQKKDEAIAALMTLHDYEIDGSPIIVEMSKRGVRSGNQDDNIVNQENGDNNHVEIKKEISEIQ